MRNNLPFLNVYKEKKLKSEVVTQLLYGESFKILKKKKSWFKIKNNTDNYIGFIKKRKFPSNLKNTHKIVNLKTNLYIKPNNKSIIKKKLSFGSKIKVVKKKK